MSRRCPARRSGERDEHGKRAGEQQRRAILERSARSGTPPPVAERRWTRQKEDEPGGRTSLPLTLCTNNTSASDATATATLYAVSTHDTPSIEVWNWP
jgi:hypothetical protein